MVRTGQRFPTNPTIEPLNRSTRPVSADGTAIRLLSGAACAVYEGPVMEKLSQILWRERELLDTLLYKLEVEQMVLAAGQTRWLMRAAREVEQVLSTIRETEILRSVAADQFAASIGLDYNPSLRALSEAVEASSPTTTKPSSR
jgi:hypothetical protein